MLRITYEYDTNISRLLRAEAQTIDMHIQDEIERKIVQTLHRKGPLTRLQLQRAALQGYLRFDYDPVLTKLIRHGIIEYTDSLYRVS